MNLKKQLGIFLILAFIISASGTAIWRLQTTGNIVNALDSTLPERIFSDMDGSWHSVITFTGVNYIETDPFYIEGDKFRVKYTAILVDDVDSQTDAKPFIVVQAKSQLQDDDFIYGQINSDVKSLIFAQSRNQLQDDDFIYGHINENLDAIISGILEVGQGNGNYHLLIWDMACAGWQIEVESYH